jgi:Acetyltransferase (GNAT) family
MIKSYNKFRLNELNLLPLRDKPTKIKLSPQYTLMIIPERLKEGAGEFELYLKEKMVAYGQFELLSRPVVEDIPHYKMVQVMGAKFYVEPKGEKSKQTNLYNIKSYKTGCGSILMDGIIKWARQSGMKTIWLDVLKENERAQYLYKKFGFQTDGEYERLAKNVNWYRMFLNL